MSKPSFARLARIVSETFGTGKDDGFSLDANLTRFEKFVHFWVLVYRSFVRNRCPVRASALSFTTLLALIPMLAVAMSISSALLKTQGEEQIKSFVDQMIENLVPPGPATTPPESAAPTEIAPLDLAPAPFASPDAVATVASTNTVSAGDGQIVVSKKGAADAIYKFIQNASSGRLGAIGVIFLLWTTIATLTRVEETFNDIWGVTRGRDWWSRISNYLVVTLLVPLLCIAALGLANSSRLGEMRSFLNLVPLLEPVISYLLPLFIVCVTFALFYKLMPNTKVHFGAALVGGALAGVTWHLFNIISLHLASRWVNASKIYGSLALIPLLMLGLYTVWVIVLFGAQVAYAYQNRASYLQEKLAEHVNQRGREFVALRLMTCIGQHFQNGLPPVTMREITANLGVPSKLAQQVLHTLLAAQLVVEVSGREPGYAPARPLETINCHHILLAMRATQGQELITRDEPVRVEVLGEFARIQAAEKAAASTVTLLALVGRAQARLELAAPTTRDMEPDGLAEAGPPVELPGEKPSGKILPEEDPPAAQEPLPVEAVKPISPVNIPVASVTAASTLNDNESFPL